MCDGIHITFPHGKSLCIPIYYEVIKWPPPPGDPWRRLLEDIRAIATIGQFAANVQNEGVRGELRQAVRAAFKTVSVQLPEGVTIGDELLKAVAGH